ncbi:MAG: hypothetical protein PHH08_05135 [Candidatus ainarchaeum sp.]|nr:hypothetical protein [Candidatus ainarchaeum sp.]
MEAKKTAGIIIALAIIAGIIWLVIQATAPAPVDDINLPDYADPKVIEGAKLPDPVPLSAQPATGGDCSQISEPIRRDYCYFVEADNTGTVGPCTKITGIAERNSCVKVLAVDRENTSFCNYSVSAFNPNDNSNVKYACISAVAEDQADETICNEIPSGEWKGKCLELAANA